MTLTAGTITGAAGTETFDNDNNTNIGTGTISNLTLLDNSGTIEASGGLLTLATGNTFDSGGRHAVCGRDCSSAVCTSDLVTNDGQIKTNGGTIDFKGSTLTNNNATNG